MKRRSLVRTNQANRDVEAVVAYLAEEAGTEIALRFVGALEGSYTLLLDQPEIERVYVPENPELGDIRSWRVHATSSSTACWERRKLKAPFSCPVSPSYVQSRRRVRLESADRILWVWLLRLWIDWRNSLLIVQPETVLRWHRQGFRL